MTVPKAGKLTRFSPLFFFHFFSLPLNFTPPTLTPYSCAVFLLCLTSSILLHNFLNFYLPIPHFTSPSPLFLLYVPYIPPSMSWFPQLLVRGRHRWLTEAEMDEVSAQCRPNGILKEQHQRPTSRRPVRSDQVWWQLYTAVPLFKSTEHHSCCLPSITLTGNHNGATMVYGLKK